MRQANRRKYHYIYKTTCKVTGKYYIGMHSTDDLNDGYLGSGQRLSRSIKKHGRENHACEIVEFLPDRATLSLRESEIVSEKLLSDPMCLNMALGGVGGFTGGLEAYNASVSKEERAFRAKVSHNPATWTDGRRAEQRARMARIAQEVKDGLRIHARTGATLSDEAKAKVGEATKGKVWITNPDMMRNKRHTPTETIPEGWRIGFVKYLKGS